MAPSTSPSVLYDFSGWPQHFEKFKSILRPSGNPVWPLTANSLSLNYQTLWPWAPTNCGHLHQPQCVSWSLRMATTFWKIKSVLRRSGNPVAASSHKIASQQLIEYGGLWTNLIVASPAMQNVTITIPPGLKHSECCDLWSQQTVAQIASLWLFKGCGFCPQQTVIVIGHKNYLTSVPSK